MHHQISRLFEKLAGTFQDNKSTTEHIAKALGALRLIAPLFENDIAANSYRLFHIVMQANISPEEKKWEASRLSLLGAYKWDKVLPRVGDPKDILAFLNHHFDLATQGEDQDEPIQNALRALAYAYNTETIEALKTFDSTKSPFVRGICFAFQNERPPQLRRAALFFLPLIADRWFNTPRPIMEPSEMQDLCTNWASAVDKFDPKFPQVRKVALCVFFCMINSPHWRPHIIPINKWKLLEYPLPVPDDFPPLRKCINNPEVIRAISNANDRNALILWSAILWLNFRELDSGIRTQLMGVTKDAQMWELDGFRSGITSELEVAEKDLLGYKTSSTDPAAEALRRKIEDLGEVQKILVGLKRK